VPAEVLDDGMVFDSSPNDKPLADESCTASSLRWTSKQLAAWLYNQDDGHLLQNVGGHKFTSPQLPSK